MQIQYINNLRAVACILVILTHSAMPALNDAFGIYMVFFSLLGSPSSELFVLISASLLAPTKLELIPFYKKRFSKLIGPFLFWSIVILIFNYYKEIIALEDIFLGIFLIPFAPATGIYWFVYTICGLYLIIPIISPWLVKATKKEMRLLLSIWSITLFLPYLNYITGKNIYDIQGNYYFFLNYLGGFIGYLFLGVYLRKYPLTFKSKMYALLSILFFLSLGLIPIIIGYGFNRELLIIAQDNLSFTSVMFVISIFCFFQNFKLPNIIESAFNVVAKYSFGIYLIHIIVVRDIVWSFLNDNRISHPIIETPIICIISLILCIIVVWLISFLPKSKYIVGV